MTDNDIYSQIINKVTRMLDDLAVWQPRFLRAVFFLEAQTDRTSLILPAGHQDLREALGASGVFDVDSISELDRMKNDLENAASDLINTVFRNQGRPELPQYDTFLNGFEAYYNSLRFLERNLQDTRRGIDPETGFKSVSVLYADLTREQDRRARRGKPFSIVLTRIDRYAELINRGNTATAQALLTISTKCLRMSLRSFDDVYRMSQDEFLVVLKQTDLPGAFRFSERIRESMLASNLRFDLDGLMHIASMSFYVAEPLPGENIKAYISQIHKDMQNGVGMVSAIAQFQEISPLERAAREAQAS